MSGIGILLFQIRKARQEKMEQAKLQTLPPSTPSSRAHTPAISDTLSDKSWIICSPLEEPHTVLH
jgi:hypothetical protein